MTDDLIAFGCAFVAGVGFLFVVGVFAYGAIALLEAEEDGRQ